MMKLFVLLSRVPYPLEKGDKLRAFHQLRYLSKFYDIHLFCINDGNLHGEAEKVLGNFCKSITIVKLSKLKIYIGLFRALLNGLPLQVGFFYHKFIKKKITETIKEVKPDHIYCQLIRVAEYVKDIDLPKTLDYQDVFSKGAERMSVKASLLMKFFLKMEAKRVEKYEREIFCHFDNKLIISEPDRDAICHPDCQKIKIVPNGVDMEYFKPVNTDKQYDILFTGNMAYPPNINSVEYLIKEILPELKKHKPSMKVLIAGTSPVNRIKKLADENVTVTGWVADIRDCYAISRVFVAPMLIGTGLQNKLLEAMAMRLPCISSGLANNALHAEENKEILIGYSTQDYVEKILSVLNNSEKYQTIADNGFRFVQAKYMWDVQCEKLYKIIETTPLTE